MVDENEFLSSVVSHLLRKMQNPIPCDMHGIVWKKKSFSVVYAVLYLKAFIYLYCVFVFLV